MSGSFPSSLFAGRSFAVLGLGRNGGPVVRALASMGARVQSWDDNADSRAGLGAVPPTVTVARFETLVGFDGLVLSPGIPHRLPAPHPVASMAYAAGIAIMSDAELLFQAVRASGGKARFAGVTGTNGKSTTTALLAHLLTVAGVPNAAGGNLGPASLALPLLPDDGVYVLEMSSYMLERLQTLRFDAAVLLNLSPDHLDRHGDMDGYARAKLAVFDRQGDGDLALVGADVGGVVLPDGIVTLGTCERRGPGLPGAHNEQNAAAAAAMARHFGVSEAAIDEGLDSFEALPHRQKTIATQDGVAFVDDSKATNADAASRALGCYERLVWIAGGIAKSGGIEDLAPWFDRVALAVLIGRDAPLLARTLADHGVAHEIAGTLEAAVPAAYRAARETGAPVVLLSPACASFDQFGSFEARGVRFAELAGEIV